MTVRELDPWVEGYLSYLGDMRRLAPRTIAVWRIVQSVRRDREASVRGSRSISRNS